MRRTTPFGAVFAVPAVFLLAACGGHASPTELQADVMSTANGHAGGLNHGQRAAKVDICHALGTGDYHLINVSANAQPAHLAHGDALPGDDYPGMDGYVFGDDCQAVDNGEGDNDGNVDGHLPGPGSGGGDDDGGITLPGGG